MITWKIKRTNPLLVAKYAKALNINSILAKVLINRSIDLKTAQAILKDPVSLLDNGTKIYGALDAARCLADSIERKNYIHVFADYDVDGIMAGTVIKRFLSYWLDEDKIDVYFPSRSEGYGLSINYCNKLINKYSKTERTNVTVVTVDNGISKIEEVALLKDAGFTVIVTDHHEPDKKELPKADALCDAFIDRKTGTHLCGAAIIWKVCLIAERLLKQDTDFMESTMPYVALATVADVMPMVPENIALVNIGLELMNQYGYAKDIKTLIAACEIKHDATYKDLGWSIGPKINSCSRMNKIQLAIDLLSQNDDTEDIAERIINLDEKRKSLVIEAMKKANEQDYSNDGVCIFDSTGYTEGIAGIIAGRLAEQYNKPAIVIYKVTDGKYSGSVRSRFGLNIFQYLQEEEKIGNLLSCGGHAEAAGLSLYVDKLQDLKQSLNQKLNTVVSELQQKQDVNSIEIDACINLIDINNKTLQEINKLSYDSNATKEPLFCIKNVFVQSVKESSNNPNHLCFQLFDTTQIRLSSWGWNIADRYNELGKPQKIDVVGKMEYGFGKTSKKATLIIVDIRKAAD